MLDLESDAQVGRTQGQVSSARSKLRDSCHACATSKIKCPREKPSCSKCESRGITCEYFLAKRPGRRRENSTSNSMSNNTSRTLSSTSLSTSSSANANTNANVNANAIANAHTNVDSNQSKEWDTIQVAQPSLDDGFIPRSTIVPTDLPGNNSYLRPPSSVSVPHSPRLDDVYSTDSNPFSMLGDISMFPGLADFGSNINDMDFIMSAMDSPLNLPGIDCGSTTQPPTDIGSLLMPAEKANLDHASSDSSSAFDNLCASSRISSLASNAQSLSTGKSSMTCVSDISPCGCLMQALDLLKMLSSTQGPHSCTFPSPSVSATQNANNFSPAQNVLTENKQSIEAVSNKLACSSCADDSFLLTILSMIVLKVLERYAAAARPQPHRTGAIEAEAAKATKLSSSIISSGEDWMRALSHAYNMPCDDKGRGRMAAQLVLSELHRVQRLVNQLSPKLKGPKEEEGQNVGPRSNAWGHLTATGDCDKSSITPFSASTLDQIERDVRKSLSTLSAEIINRLRQR